MWNVHIHTGTRNVHNVHNAHIYNIGIPKHEKHLRLLSSGTKLFITFELKSFSTQRERYTWLFHLPQTTCAPDTMSRQARESQPSSSDNKTQLTDFSQISAHASGHDVIHIPRSYFPIWGFYFDISELHILPARASTPALKLHLNNPCAKRKVLSLTKPKGKIYKTKSLGHYITRTHFFIKIWSLPLYSQRVVFLVCEKWVGDSGRTAILTPTSSSIIAALLSHLGWVTQSWVAEDLAALSLQADSHAAGILSPTDSSLLCPGYIIF